MERQAIFPSGRPRPNAPISPGIRFGNLLFLSGAVGTGADGKVPVDIRGQTLNALNNLRIVLEAAGSGLDHVLKTSIYLTDMSEFAAMNEAYKSVFCGDLPARTTVGVAALARPELRLEIEMVAYIP